MKWKRAAAYFLTKAAHLQRLWKSCSSLSEMAFPAICVLEILLCNFVNVLFLLNNHFKLKAAIKLNG
jgi:hypothetical protein